VFGWKGTVLRVDLTNRRVRRQPLPQDLARDWIGGRGLGAKLLYDEVPAGTHALSRENRLYFTAGPLTGTPIGCGRVGLTSKSPQSGLYMEGSAGGFFGPELHLAGYDIVALEGASEKPVYIAIRDGDVQIVDASHLWGKTTSQTYSAIVGEFGDRDVQVRSIGPAGERLVNVSTTIGNLHRAGGRSLGAVMGAKKVKALAVRGTGATSLADPKAFREAMDEVFFDLNMENSIDPFTKQFGIYGSPVILRYFNEIGGLATNNAQKSTFEGADGISDVASKRLVTKPKACFCCPIPSCGHWLSVTEGKCAGTELEGVQTTSQVTFGSMLGISSFEAVAKAQLLSNDLGLDLYAGIPIAWAYEAYQRGLLTKKETGGLELTWGNEDALFELLRMTAYREGLGDYLADGAKIAAERLGGGSEFALHSKGMDWEIIHPNAVYTHALGLAVNSVGSDHTAYYPPYPPSIAAIPPEILNELGFDVRKAGGRLTTEEKGPLLKWSYDSRAVLDSLEFCLFISRGRLYTDFRPYAKAMTAATGIHYDWKGLLAIGERICNLERAFNVREGASRKDDTIPERFMKLPADGGSTGSIVPLDRMLDDYYRARGWDLKSGNPTRATLERVGLKGVADDLERMGRLPAPEKEAA
jgi:aldehyde:ferredoxin oxidoreductase